MFYDENGNFDEEAHGASLEAYEKELAEFDEIRRLMKARDAVRDRAQDRKAREDDEVKRRDDEQKRGVVRVDEIPRFACGRRRTQGATGEGGEVLSKGAERGDPLG